MCKEGPCLCLNNVAVVIMIFIGIMVGVHVVGIILIMCMETYDWCEECAEKHCCLDRWLVSTVNRTTATIRTITKPVQSACVMPSEIVMVRNPDGKLQLGMPSMV